MSQEFTHPVRAIFRQNPCPRDGLVAHLVYFPPELDNTINPPGLVPEYWTIRLYTDNFNSFSAEDRMVIFNWVSDTLRLIRVVEPRCYVEKYEKVPR